MRGMFQQEEVSLLQKREGALLWQEGILLLFQYLEENRAVCLCALNSLGRDTIKRFFNADIYAVIETLVVKNYLTTDGDGGVFYGNATGNIHRDTGL